VGRNPFVMYSICFRFEFVLSNHDNWGRVRELEEAPVKAPVHLEFARFRQSSERRS
jgi:hypothetical protein